MSKSSDLWVSVKFEIEGSEWCKEVRESDSAPAFEMAINQICLDKGCKFMGLCLELVNINEKDKEDKGCEKCADKDCCGCEK